MLTNMYLYSHVPYWYITDKFLFIKHQQQIWKWTPIVFDGIITRKQLLCGFIVYCYILKQIFGSTISLRHANFTISVVTLKEIERHEFMLSEL